MHGETAAVGEPPIGLDRVRAERAGRAGAARQAREAGIPLQVNSTVCAKTVDDLPALRDLVADLGAVLWSVFFLVPVGRGRALDAIPRTARKR